MASKNSKNRGGNASSNNQNTNDLAAPTNGGANYDATNSSSSSSSSSNATANNAPATSGSDMLAAVGQKAGTVIEPIKKLAISQLDTQKERAVNGLYSVSTTIRQLDDGLREQNQANVAQYGDTAARQIERFTSYLREHDTRQLLQEVGNAAKRQPVLFVGGALTLGLLAARFLKSSGSGNDSNNAAQISDNATNTFTANAS